MCVKERGAIFIEFVLVFPIFLAVIFILMFIGTGYNARNSLSHAMNSVRLAVTRGDETRVGSQIVPAVQSFDRSGLEPFLSTPGLETALDPGQYYDQMTVNYFPGGTTTSGTGVPGATDMFDVSPHYLYAHIYIVQAMKQSVGPALKAPCDPTGNGPNDGPGCLKCVSFSPSFIDSSPTDQTDTLEDLHPFYPNFIGIECTYRPDNILLGPIQAMIRLMTGNNSFMNLSFTRQQVYRFQ